MILDFIGNYMSNFMIPIALSGDRSYNKDAMRRYLREGARIIPEVLPFILMRYQKAIFMHRSMRRGPMILNC